MALYTLKDVELVDSKIDDITDKIEKKKLDIFEPTKKELLDANIVVMQFIKDKKRKIYGGYAQNKVIVAKDPKDAFYDEDDLPDIDVYSPEPLKDLVELCNILHSKGFKDVAGQEAQHKETYKIFVNGGNVIDLSYVPRNIYNKMPFIEINGINYMHPSFVYIDLYKMLTDPYFSGSHRWKKVFPRIYKLQKHYPFNKASKPLNNAYDVPKDKKEIVNQINKTIIDHINNKENYIIVGQYAYNYLLEESGIMKDKQLGGKYKLIEIPFMQLIATEYIPNTTEIISKLKETYGDKISYKEFYPLWTTTGYSTVVYYDGFAVLHITSHNDRCVQVRKVNTKYYNNGKSELYKDGFVDIGCFDFIFLMNLISGFRTRVNGIEDKYHYHNIMTSHLIEIRNYYLEKNKKTLLDESLFMSFIPDCVGETIDPVREARQEAKRKRKEGKAPIYRYDPSKPRDAPDYKFANTSGNEINKSRNLKVTRYIENPELLKTYNKNQEEEIEELDENIAE
ncbi:polyA polymerase [Fadolivirus algeromassiliense]|jgi:hypothetical protein|uniref:Putative poly(A) polymerase catalytic subunit n=1 Tax=Fadolivirus FV1/VV64 TaxID=3070911 RepID=A0A7D3QU20_9VIRU|nr:polyA polymerase [Fadolivirus algeromassiliense]QKF93805.1 polyA polymerase [Fadolivirus FV1/VV64]